MKTDNWKLMNDLKIYFWFSACIWTVAVGVSLVWNVYQARSTAIEAALIQARVGHEKDVLYRRWNAMMERVYVPVSENLQPNKYLSTDKRDVFCRPDLKLTMVNPAYMTRMVHDLQGEGLTAIGHITSLEPLNPTNEPDPWEKAALEELKANKSITEVTTVQSRRDGAMVRLMRPLAVESSCLACHQEQGYKVGDLRGGISSSVPFRFSYWDKQVTVVVAGHLILWALSIAGMLSFLRLLISSEPTLGNSGTKS